jgi:hypothetical protein
MGEARFSFFAGSTPPTSVGVAASAERLESGYRRGFPRVRDECFEKLMEVTPESGFSQDRRKYIPVCAKIPGRRRFRPKLFAGRNQEAGKRPLALRLQWHPELARMIQEGTTNTPVRKSF